MTMDNMGKPIPASRKDAAYKWLKEDLGHDSDTALNIVGMCAESLERDEPAKALEVYKTGRIDLTGAYRLMSVLLTDPL